MPNQKVYNSRAKANTAVENGLHNRNSTIKYKTSSGNVVTRKLKKAKVLRSGGEYYGDYEANGKKIVNTNNNIAAKEANAAKKEANAAKKKANNNAARRAIVYNSRAKANTAVENGLHNSNSTIKYKTSSGNVVTRKLEKATVTRSGGEYYGDYKAKGKKIVNTNNNIAAKEANAAKKEANAAKKKANNNAARRAIVYNSRAKANTAVHRGLHNSNSTIKYKTSSGNVVTRKLKKAKVLRSGGEYYGDYEANGKKIANTNNNIAAKKANAAKKKANNNAAHMAIVYNSRAKANTAVNNGLHNHNSTIKYKTSSGNVVTRKLENATVTRYGGEMMGHHEVPGKKIVNTNA